MQRASRKKEHIQFAVQTGQSGNHGFDDVKFVPNSIPESKYSSTCLNTMIGGLHLSSPIIINAMTGGTDETAKINEKLAVIAKECGLAMAVGSQMAAIKEPSESDSYSIIRRVHPNGIFMANLGAEATVSQALQAVEMIEANMLQIHLNVMQEMIMPEGDRDFRGVCERIQAIVEAVPCPVLIKEVGFGISHESVARLLPLGISVVDVGGSGGTNFAKIENQRRTQRLEMFNDWGMTTVQSLLEMAPFLDQVDIVATGGIRNGLEITKALALGASAVGMAGFFLQLVLDHDIQESIEEIQRLHHQIRLAMTVLGAERIEELRKKPLVISGDSFHWANMRGFDCSLYSKR